MKKFSKKRFIWLGIIIFFFLAVLYFIYYYTDLIFGPPVLFWNDDYIEINLYPKTYNAAVVFTVDDVYKLTKPEKILKVTEILDKYKVKGVFFVIPYYKGRYRINKDDTIAETLRKIEKDGHEIGQHGLTHWVPRRKLKIINYARELTDLPYGEQKRRIAIGKKILEEAGLQVKGFRAPAFSANKNTLKVLDHLDFLYGSDAGLYPPPYMLANKMFVESIYYPYHPSDLNIIEFVSHGDLFRTHLNSKNFMLIKHRFRKVYKKKGVFVLYTHIEPLNTQRSLQLLEESLKEITNHNVWKPTLSEIALWWKAREALYAETKIIDDTLLVTLEKGNELELKDLTILFKQGIPARKYIIITGEGYILKKGKIDEKSVSINY